MIYSPRQTKGRRSDPSESVIAVRGDRLSKSILPESPFKKQVTGSNLVRITGSGLLLGVTVGFPIAYRLRTNTGFESGTASKAESMTVVPLSLYNLYPLQIKGGMVSQNFNLLGISGTVPEHTHILCNTVS